jgi:hypothetical protein
MITTTSKRVAVKLIIVDLGSGSCWTHSGSPLISLSNTSISNPPNPVSSLQISSRLFLKKVLLRERYRPFRTVKDKICYRVATHKFDE